MLLIYHDVMEADHCDLLIQEHDTNPNKHLDNPLDQSFDSRVLLLQNMTRPSQELAAGVTMEIAKVLGHHFRTALYPETVSVVRWSAGEEMALHRDGHNPHTINRTHAVVLYLNDQLEGGEIHFPEIGVTVSPRRALMVAYDKSILHGVRPVTQPRYTLTMWYTDQSELSIIR